MHPLVAPLRQARGSTILRALPRGLALPVRAARFLATHRTLWPLVIVPACIHGVLLVGAVVLVFAYADAAATWLWPPPAGDALWTWVLLAVWYVFYVVVVAAGLIAGYAATLLISGVVASPFNDALAERVEALLRDNGPAPVNARPFWKEALRSLRATALILALYLALMVPVLLFNLLPGVGSVIATALSTGVGAFFLALEFTDLTLSRYGYSLRAKMQLLRTHPGLTAGFGLGTSLLLWIPGLNLLCAPVAVVGGTALALALLDDGTPESA